MDVSFGTNITSAIFIGSMFGLQENVVRVSLVLDRKGGKHSQEDE